MTGSQERDGEPTEECRRRPSTHLSRPLDAILARPAAIRVLRVLLRHGGWLPAPRLSRESGVTAHTLRSALGDLLRHRIVEEAGGGRIRLYRSDRDHPLTVALAALFRAEADYRVAALAEVIHAAQDLGFRALWLFGSVARHEDSPNSDLDLMPVLDTTTPADFESRMEIYRLRLSEARDLTGLRPSVAPVTTGDVGGIIAGANPVWPSLLRDGVALIGPTPKAFSKALAASGREARAARDEELDDER